MAGIFETYARNTVNFLSGNVAGQTKLYNPRTKNLMVLSVKLRTTQETIRYLFPLNPSSLTINQASRVSSIFTYGSKVFQNLGAGLKTISIEGHTGYRLDYPKYGTQGFASDLAVGAEDLDPNAPRQEGKKHWLDLYAIVQLIKGENIFIKRFSTIKDKFSIDNIDNIELVQITIPDQGITYDVILQNDSFMRNREQPHLYKYRLNFIVTGESLGTPLAIRVSPDVISSAGDYVDKLQRLSGFLSAMKKDFVSLPGIRDAISNYDRAMTATEGMIRDGNFFITAANSSLNDLRRLERMTEAANSVTKNLSLVRQFVDGFQTLFSGDLKTAFYEPYIAFKNVGTQADLLLRSMKGEQENLSFNVSMTQLASTSTPVTIAANKATVGQVQKDIRKLNQITFPFPVDHVEEVTTDGITKINVFFKSSPGSLGISDIKIYTPTDFGYTNNLVESISDTVLVLNTSYYQTGYIYNFIIEYNYTTFESIVQPRYKSIKRIMIKKGDTIDSIVKEYAPNEANASKTYLSQIAYLNNVEYPYIVTSDNANYEAYFGSYGYKIFATNGEFLQYIYNINILSYPGPNMPLYSSTITDETSFLLQEPEVITQIKTGSYFFVLLFKEIYSSRCYALFGITNNSICNLFSADSYVLCSLDKGRSYDVDNNTLFEILSPYTLNKDLVDYYGQTALYDLLLEDAGIDLFDKSVEIINAIYTEKVGSFWIGSNYPFTAYDHNAEDQQLEYIRFYNNQKVFLAGDEDNKNYVIFTNFTATGAATISSYSIAAFSIYKILSEGQEILLPSFEDRFLPFAEAFSNEDTYKVDLDVRFQYFDDIHVSILPPSDITSGVLDFKLVYGIDNVKQAIKNRLECPQGGLILHKEYGLPMLLGKKNTLEHLVLLRYNLFSQLLSDPRIRSVDEIQVESKGDAITARAAITIANNDNVQIQTTL